ncbi:MAG: MoaD/ThiS family protein [Anaerolineae bacterium]
MAITVYIPTPLRRLTTGQPRVEAWGSNVAALIEDLEVRFPGLKEQLCQGDGQIKHHINVFVNGQEIRSLQGEGTALHDGDEVAFIPAMAGGNYLDNVTLSVKPLSCKLQAD